MSIITDTEAIQSILMRVDERPSFACYLGAGASAEAGVKTAAQICEEIHDELLKKIPPNNQVAIQAVEKSLTWDDPRLRYMSCLKKRYSDSSQRVEYFRHLLKGVNPSFAHHALALLITHRYLQSSCVTTNFDKLLENAFVQQGNADCQPIRTVDELKFWRKERNSVLKLHGDYDTLNLSNTKDETVIIPKELREAVADILDFRGLVVIGTAGYEKSIHTMFDALSAIAQESQNVLWRGLLWGVYVGESKPSGLTDDDINGLVRKQLDDGAVSDDIRSMIENAKAKGKPFHFFPVWGAANFMYDLLKATEDRELIGTAQRYLDRKMRLRNVFTRAGLSEEAITKHLSTLELKRTHSRTPGPAPEEVYQTTSKTGKVELRVLYGDITSRTFMGSTDFQGLRRAVISPDDTFITAGGGVAEGLLDKAGRQFLLNELAKFDTPFEQGAVAVTSGGNLPVHYLFHAAAIKVGKDGVYSVSRESIYASMTAALDKALLLNVGALWVPLMGTGAAGLAPSAAFDGILEAIRDWKGLSIARIIIMVFVYNFKILDKSEIKNSIEKILGQEFKL